MYNGLLTFFYIAPCIDGQLRLSGSNIANEGRVEICMNNEWGTICDENWGSSDATVVCRQLGYPTQCQQIFISSISWLYSQYVLCQQMP